MARDPGVEINEGTSDAEQFDPNGCHRCTDFDEDCFGLDHLNCWLLDPTTGICPFLNTDDE